MAEPNQHLTPPPVTIAKAPEDVPGDGHPLSDPNTSFTVLEYSSSPLHAETRKRSGPHPPPDPGNLGTLEEVDHGRRSLRTKSLQTISIMNGLKLRLKGQTTLLAAYTYALFPRMEKCVPVDWKILVTDDVQSQHIRCHPLQEGDELSMLVSNFKEQHAKAVILINTQDNYSIAPQFLEGMKKSNTPIVVITQSDGANLLASLDKHGDDIQARLDAESDVDALVGGGQEESLPSRQSPGTARKKSDNQGPGVKQRGWKNLFGSDKGSTMDLRAELKKLMFTGDKKPALVSDDPAKFTMVMSILTNYEKQAKEDGNHATVNETLKKMKPHIDELFYKDLPFYLVFAYRLHIRYTLYQCEEMGTFIPACLKKIEGLNYKELAQIINDFAKRGDFQVMCGTTKEEESVGMFWFMECACQELSEVSQNLNNKAVQSQSQGPATNVRPVHPNFCYTRMMWLSMALKLHCERTQVTRTTPRLWYDRFINYHPRIILTDAVLKDLVDGLDFGRVLYLPKEVHFSFHHMTDLVVSERCVRPFKQVRHFLRSMEQFLETEDEMFHVLTHIRATYTSKMKEPGFSMAKVSTLGTLADTISEAKA